MYYLLEKILHLLGQGWLLAQLGAWRLAAQQELATPRQVVRSWYKMAGCELMVQVLLELLTINCNELFSKS